MVQSVETTLCTGGPYRKQITRLYGELVRLALAEGSQSEENVLLAVVGTTGLCFSTKSSPLPFYFSDFDV